MSWGELGRSRKGIPHGPLRPGNSDREQPFVGVAGAREGLGSGSALDGGRGKEPQELPGHGPAPRLAWCLTAAGALPSV